MARVFCHKFVTLLFVVALLLLTLNLYERHLWRRIVAYVNARTAGGDTGDKTGAGRQAR